MRVSMLVRNAEKTKDWNVQVERSKVGTRDGASKRGRKEKDEETGLRERRSHQ